MIDSIQFRLYNLRKYPVLRNSLLEHSKKKVTNFVGKLPKDEHAQTFYLSMQEFGQEGKLLYDANGEKLTSSHYSLAWRLPVGGADDYCEFNFSIPKLIYGTNIIQFVQHKAEGLTFGRGFNYNGYKANQENTLRRLMQFFRRFFPKYFWTGDFEVDLNDIEIIRFDVCFNQYFNSKREALHYLEYQKNVKKKHLRITSKNQTGFATSVFFSTRDYGCKIYHKGSEYHSEKGERKKHLEANKNIESEGWKGRKVKFDVKKLEQYADKILRYEITFRKSYLSKIFWNHCFRRKNAAWQLRMKKFKECRRIAMLAYGKQTTKKEVRQFFLSVFMGKVRTNELFIQTLIKRYQWDFQIINLRVGLTKPERNFYFWWSKQKEKYVSFRLVVPQNITDINVGIVKTVDLGNGIEKELSNEARFSPYLLSRCFKIFDSFRDHFEIKEKTHLSETVRRMEEYNSQIATYNASIDLSITPKKRKMELGKVRAIIALLENDTLEGLVKKGIISRWTAIRYEKKFKVLDVNLHTGSMVDIWNCRDFTEYHNSLAIEGMGKYLINTVFK